MNEYFAVPGIEEIDGDYYFVDNRDSIDVSLPRNNIIYDQSRIIGVNFSETIQLNRKWLNRLFHFFIFYIVGIIFFCNLEGWNVRTAIYFITQTVSTVGYGTVSPQTIAGQNFCILYMFCALLLVFAVLGDFRAYIVAHSRRKTKKLAKRSKVTIILRSLIIVAMWSAGLILLLLFGSVVYWLNEGWSFRKAFYFCALTATTMGYTDTLAQPSSIWFNNLFILVSVSTTALALDKIGNIRRQIAEAEQDQQLNSIELTQELLAAINKDTQRITPAEYVLHMLQLAGKLDRQADILPWLAKFDEFDSDHDGLLTQNDVNTFALLNKEQQINSISTLTNNTISGGSSKELDLSKLGRKRTNTAATGSVVTVKNGRKMTVFQRISDETRAVWLEMFNIRDPVAAAEEDGEVVDNYLKGF